MASLQWGGQPVPSVAGCHGHCCAGVWGGSPQHCPGLPPGSWLPDQPVPQMTARGHGLAARVGHVGPCKGRLSTCSCSQCPVMNLDFHFFPPSSDNAFAKEAAAVNPPQMWGAQGGVCPGAGSCLAEHPRGSHAGGTVPPPAQASSVGSTCSAQLSSQAAWDSVSGLAGRLSNTINTTLVARAGSEAG